MVSIQLFWLYLKHDIDQYTHRLGEARVEDAEKKDSVQSEDNQSDTSFYLRCIRLGVAKLKVLLKNKLTAVNTDASDVLTEYEGYARGETPYNPHWEFVLKSGYRYDTQAIAELLHHFIVYYCIKEWSIINAPDNITAVNTELESTQTEIGTAILAPPVKERRPMVEEEPTIVIR